LFSCFLVFNTAFCYCLLCIIVSAYSAYVETEFLTTVSAVAGFSVKSVVIGFILFYFSFTYACAEIVVVMQYTAAVCISLCVSVCPSIHVGM